MTRERVLDEVSNALRAVDIQPEHTVMQNITNRGGVIADIRAVCHDIAISIDETLGQIFSIITF